MPASTILDTTRSHNGIRPQFSPVSAGDRGDDSFDLNIPVGHGFLACNLEVTDGNYRQGARFDALPALGSTGTQRLRVHWYFDGGLGRSFIDYHVTAASLPLAELVPAHKVRGFLPSSSGLHFVNSFKRVTVMLRVGQVLVPMRGANGGACGGMAFATRDFFEAGFLVPGDTTTPESGALYDLIMTRLGDSFHLPNGPLRYAELMNPGLKDADAKRKPFKRGRGSILRKAWAQLRADIDADRLSAVGLVLVRSRNPLQLANNHQVLAYGYTTVSDREGQIYLYDPNFPNDDRVVIDFRVEDDGTVSRLVSPYATLVGFFRNDYSLRTPQRPTLGSTPRIRLKHGTRSIVGSTAGLGRSDAPSPPESIYTVERTASGELRSGEWVNLRASNQRYVVAEDRGGGVVRADRAAPFQWERFVVDKGGANLGVAISGGDLVTLRTDGDRYLALRGFDVRADASAPVEAAAQFTVDFV